MIRESHTLFSVHNLERSYHSQAMFSLFIPLTTPRNSFNSLIHFFFLIIDGGQKHCGLAIRAHVKELIQVSFPRVRF